MALLTGKGDGISDNSQGLAKAEAAPSYGAASGRNIAALSALEAGCEFFLHCVEVGRTFRAIMESVVLRFASAPVIVGKHGCEGIRIEGYCVRSI